MCFSNISQLNCTEETYEETKFMHKSEALPRGLFIAKWGLDDASFDRCLGQGEVKPVLVNGETWYAAKSFTITEVQGKREGSKIEDQQKLNKDCNMALGDAFDKLGWKFQELPMPKSTALGSGALAITDIPSVDEKLWFQMKEMVEEARIAFLKIEKDCMRCLPKVESNRDDPIYKNLSFSCTSGFPVTLHTHYIYFIRMYIENAHTRHTHHV